MYLPDLPKMPDQDYERQIRRICAVPAMADVESPAEPPVDLTVFICFTNRSGSNYVASLLATTGELPTGHEMFNVKAVSSVWHVGLDEPRPWTNMRRANPVNQRNNQLMHPKAQGIIEQLHALPESCAPRRPQVGDDEADTGIELFGYHVGRCWE